MGYSMPKIDSFENVFDHNYIFQNSINFDFFSFVCIHLFARGYWKSGIPI